MKTVPYRTPVPLLLPTLCLLAVGVAGWFFLRGKGGAVSGAGAAGPSAEMVSGETPAPAAPSGEGAAEEEESTAERVAKIKEARAAAAKEGADFEAELTAIGKEWEGVINAATARDPALEPLLRDYAPLQGRYLRGLEDSLRLKLARWMENEKLDGHTRRSGQARALRQHAMAKAAVELLRGGSALLNEYSRTDTGPVLRELAAAPGYLEQPSTPEEWRDWEDPMLSGAIPREVLRALAERPEETLAALHAAIGPPVDEMAWPLLEDYEAASVQPTLGQFILSSALQTRLTPEELAVKARFDASMTRWRERADRMNQ